MAGFATNGCAEKLEAINFATVAEFAGSTLLNSIPERN